MDHHPATAIIPPMCPSQYQRLRDDILHHGQQTPIVLYEGMILDGRYRYQACRELGVEPATVRLSSEDIDGRPYTDAASANLHRRHCCDGAAE